MKYYLVLHERSFHVSFSWILIILNEIHVVYQVFPHSSQVRVFGWLCVCECESVPWQWKQGRLK